MLGSRTSVGWRRCLGGTAAFWIGSLATAADPPTAAPAAEQSAAEQKPDNDAAPDAEARRQALLGDRDRLLGETTEHQAAGALTAAIASGQKLLAVEREVLGPDHEDVDSSLQWLAEMCALNGNTDEAGKYAKESLANQTRLHGADGWSAATSRQTVKYVERVAQLDEAQRKSLSTAVGDYLQALALRRQGKSADALSISRQASTAYQDLLGEKHLATARSLQLVGSLQTSVGQNAEATSTLAQAVTLFQQAVGQMHPDTASCLIDLGYAQWNLARFDQAVAAYRQAVEIREQLFGQENGGTHDSLISLASALGQEANQLEQRDEFAAALKLRSEALATWQRVYGPEDWRVVNARVWLHRVKQFNALPADRRKKLAEARRLASQLWQFYNAGKYDEALAPGQASLNLYREILGSDSTDTAWALSALGRVKAAKKEFPSSEALFSEAIAIWRKAKGDAHPDVAMGMQDLAEMHETSGQLDQAQQIMRQARQILQGSYGPDDSDTIRSSSRLAGLLYNVASKVEDGGDYAAAKALRAEIVAIRTQLSGADDWRTVEARWFLAFDELRSALSAEQLQKAKDANAMFVQAEQFAAAKQLGPAIAAMEEAASLRKDVYGPQNLEYGLALRRSAQFNILQGNNTRAAELYGQFRDLVKAEWSGDHPFYATTISNLADVYVAQKNFSGAAELFREAWQTRSRAFGSNNETTLESADRLLDVLGKLAAAQDAKPDPAGAKKTREEVIALLTGRYGEKDWRVNDARWALYQTERLPSLRPNQRQQLTQADSLLAQAAQIYQRLKGLSDGFPKPTSAEKAAAAQPGVQAATQSVTLRKQILGEGNPAVADALEWLAVLQRAGADPSRAQTSYEQALAIRGKAQGKSHPGYVKTRESLTRVLAEAMAIDFQRPSTLTPAQQKRLVERNRYEAMATQQIKQGNAQAAYQNTLSMLQVEREVFGEVHEDVAGSYKQLVMLADNLGEGATARQYRTRLLDVYSKLYGPESWQAKEIRHDINYLDRVARMNDQQRTALFEALQLTDKLRKDYPDSTPDEQMAEIVLVKSAAMRKMLRETLGEDNIFIANSLVGDAVAYRHLDKPAEAENAEWQAAEITGRVFGKKHPVYLTRLNRLARDTQHAAVEAERNQKFELAQSIWTKRIVIQTLHYGPEHWQVRKARARLAFSQQMEKLSPAARSELDAAQNETNGLNFQPGETPIEDVEVRRASYETFRKVLGEDNPNTIDRLHELALALRSKGENGQALTLLRKTLELRRRVQGPDYPDTARATNDLGLTYFYLGSYVEAEPLLRAARETLEKMGRNNDPTYAASLNNLAVVYQALGDNDRAEPLLRQVVNISVPKSDTLDVDPDNEYAKISAGNYESLMGVCSLAEAFHRFSRDNVSVPMPKGPELTELPQYVNNLGLLYQKRGDYRQAETLLRQSLGLIRNIDTDGKTENYAVGLSNLASVFMAQGQLDRAELLLERVLQIRQDKSEYDPRYATTLNNLAAVYFRLGDTNRAGELWNQALALRSKILGQGNPNTLTSLCNVALLADCTGDPARAAEQLDQVLDRATANLHLATTIQSERQQLILRQAQRGYLDYYLSLATRAQVPAEQSYRHVLTWKGAVATDQRRLRELRQLARGKGNEEVAKLYATLEETTRQLATLTFEGVGSSDHSRQRFEKLSLQKDELERELAQRGKQSGGRADRQLSVAQLKELLPSKAALVDLVEYAHLDQPAASGAADKRSEIPRQNRLLAFVIRKDRPITMHELGPTDKIDKLVDGCRELWLHGKRSKGADPAGELRTALWEPLLADLAGAETVLVAPDGAMARLPLAALPGKEPNTYLIEDVSIAMIPVPQMLGELLSAPAPRAGSASKLLLVGNVDFGADPGGQPNQQRSSAAPRGSKPTNFGELPATLDEVTAVKQLYAAKFKPDTVSLLQLDGATEAAVRKQAVAAKYLHLATHGFFAPAEVKSSASVSTNPLAIDAGDNDQTAGWNPGLLSGVVLAGVNRPSDGSHDDGILTAAEVADMNLSAAQLVVLSACETGLGQVAGGEGVLGLQRAFHIAGARTVLSSLWKVDDRATQLLMTQFYDNLWNKNLPPLAAFRAAQLSLLNGTVDVSALRGLDEVEGPDEEKPADKRLAPRLWAPFVLSGSPN